MKTSEACPTCQGTGAVQASILITDTIESAIHQAIEKEAHKRLTVMMHPIIEAYIKQGWFNSILRQWQRTHGIKIHVESNSSMEILEFHSLQRRGRRVGVRSLRRCLILSGNRRTTSPPCA